MSALVLSCVVPGEPVAWERAGVFVPPGTRKPVHYTKDATKEGEERVAQYMQTAVRLAGLRLNRELDPYACYRLEAIFHTAQVGRFDGDNGLKLLADGITKSKAVWHDDRQVTEWFARKVQDTENPRTLIIVTLLEQRIELAKRSSRRKAA
jgi:Holliday junction resolvase RusA-like endonuclease